MFPVSKLPLLLAAALSLCLPACGGDPDRTEDRAQIEELVGEVNRASLEGDARAYCKTFSPESLEKAFITLSRCVRETDEVLEGPGQRAAGEGKLEIAEIAFADDRAKAELTGRTGEVNLVKVDGRWYLELVEEPPAELVIEEDSGAQ